MRAQRWLLVGPPRRLASIAPMCACRDPRGGAPPHWGVAGRLGHGPRPWKHKEGHGREEEEGGSSPTQAK
jgi:hypothetical protein